MEQDNTATISSNATQLAAKSWTAFFGTGLAAFFLEFHLL
jgi:hypothetical protein